MSKRSKSSSKSAAASSPVAASSPSPSPSHAASSPRTKSSKSSSSNKHSKKSSSNSSSTSTDLPYPLPVGITNEAFTREYISPNEPLKRLWRRVEWAWRIHGVSVMLDPWEIVLLNTSAIALSAAVGYYCVNTAWTMLS